MGLYVSSSQCGFFSASRWNESSSSWVAMISSTADVPDELAYKIVRTVFDNIDVLRRQHPAFRGLEAGRMMKQGLSAPLHPGAERYYREIGMM